MDGAGHLISAGTTDPEPAVRETAAGAGVWELYGAEFLVGRMTELRYERQRQQGGLRLVRQNYCWRRE